MMQARFPSRVGPLQPPDADLLLNLQPMVAEIYARSRYDQDIDYTKRLSPPLSGEDLEWLRGRSSLAAE